MRNIIKVLLYMYFEANRNTTGLTLYSDSYDYGFKIKKEKI